jgi:putative membrane protein
MDLSALGASLISVFIYSVLGIVMFAIAFLVMVKITPFSVVKEIEEDQNTSLGILFGSVFIGLSIIIAAAIS